MTPFAGFILRVLRSGSLASAGFVVLVIAAELWKRWRFGGFETMTRQDVIFMGVLVAMLACFLWLAFSIKRELAKHGP